MHYAAPTLHSLGHPAVLRTAVQLHSTVWCFGVDNHVKVMRCGHTLWTRLVSCICCGSENCHSWAIIPVCITPVPSFVLPWHSGKRRCYVCQCAENVGAPGCHAYVRLLEPRPCSCIRGWVHVLHVDLPHTTCHTVPTSPKPLSPAWPFL